jgi:hypothetical protein
VLLLDALHKNQSKTADLEVPAGARIASARRRARRKCPPARASQVPAGAR